MAAVGTGPLITMYGSDLAHIGRTPVMLFWDVVGQAWDESEEDQETAVLRSLPIGTIMFDASIACTKAAAVTGEDTLSLQLALVGGDDIVFQGTTDNGGAIDVIDRGVVLSADQFPVAETVNLEVMRDISADTGTGIAGAASYRVQAWFARPNYDR